MSNRPLYREFASDLLNDRTYECVQAVKKYFCELHDGQGQLYSGMPYSNHLNFVAAQDTRFKHLTPVKMHKYRALIMFVIYGHDSIEDCGITYNNVKETVGEKAAEAIFLCTEDKGRTRDARKSPEWYAKLNTNELAVYVKLCDIIANSLFSFLTNSSMFEKYKAEYFAKVKPGLYKTHKLQYGEMFQFLENIYAL